MDLFDECLELLEDDASSDAVAEYNDTLREVCGPDGCMGSGADVGELFPDDSLGAENIGILIAEGAEDLGLDAEASAAGAAADDAEFEEPLPGEDHGAEPEPWELLQPKNKLGEVKDPTGKRVLRIQRGKPKDSVFVNCYLHNSCSLLLSLKRAPESDIEIYKWLYSVEENLPTDNADQKKEKRDKHKALGMGLWGAPKKDTDEKKKDKKKKKKD